MAGPAINQFEIKTLSVEPGDIEFQSQNAFFFGNPRRRVLDDNGDLEGDDNTIAKRRHGLEIEVGLTSFLKTRLGIEYEQERVEDVSPLAGGDAFAQITLDEFAAEAVAVLIPRVRNGFGLGMIVEYEHPAEKGGARTLNGGPIFEWGSGALVVSFNPTITKFFGGERNDAGRADEKIDFNYTARALYRWSAQFALAIEAYGTVERIAGSGAKSDAARTFGDFDQHRAGPVAYFTYKAADDVEATLGVGALLGLNSDTADAALKLSLEVTY